MVQNDDAAWAFARRRKRAAMTPLASPWAAFHIGTGGQPATLEQMKQDKLLDPWRQLSSASVSTDGFLETLYNGLIRASEHQHMTM